MGPGLGWMSPHRKRRSAPMNTPFELRINAKRSLILIGDIKTLGCLRLLAKQMLCHTPIDDR